MQIDIYIFYRATVKVRLDIQEHIKCNRFIVRLLVLPHAVRKHE